MFRRDRRLIRLVLPIIVLAMGGYGSAGLYAIAPDPVHATKHEIVPVVRTMETRVTSVRPTLTLYGTTVAGRQLVLRSHVAGKVAATGRALREGGEAAEGEMLLQIDPFDYAGAVTEAKARVDETRALIREVQALVSQENEALTHAREQLALSEADLERAVAVGRKNLSAKAVDDRRVLVSQRKQAVAAHENTVLVLNARAVQKEAALQRLQWRYKQARQRLAETTLEAPFDGYVVDVKAQVGRRLDTSDSVATLIDKQWIEVRFTLGKRQFARIQSEHGTVSGRKVEVHWHLGDRDLVYPATVAGIAPRIAANKGGIEIFARIDDAARPFPLRPGAFVEVRVPDRAYRQVVRLPPTALYDGDTVYVVRDQRLESRRVEILGGTGGDLLVRGDVVSGDRVVSSRLTNPKAGLKVKEL